MSEHNDEEGKAPEILIIRRGGHGGEEGHHGGVWKIAYADFMTAMMAFFLVMWLINSSDKKTLTQVANYFNPLRLTDKTAVSKGLHEANSNEQTQQGDEASSSGETPGGKKEKAKKDNRTESKGDPKGMHSDQAIFQDPLSMLDRIASEAKESNEVARANANGAPAEDNKLPSDLVRDPFDPNFLQQVEILRKSDQAEAPGGGALDDRTRVGGTLGNLPDKSKQGGFDDGDKPGQGGIGDLAERGLGGADSTAKRMAAANPPAKKKSATTAEFDEGAPAKAKAATKGDQAEAAAAAAAEQAKVEAETARTLEKEIKTSVMQAIKGAAPNIEVTVTDEGILISVTDDYDFPMFSVASAEPQPNLVLAMEKLAGVLAKQSEPIVVRGHTDSRQYRKGGYDNWRLSTARAHMAYYMLLRGGIDEKRFEKIEGFADKRLRVPNSPLAAPNRRIEILLRRPRA